MGGVKVRPWRAWVDWGRGAGGGRAGGKQAVLRKEGGQEIGSTFDSYSGQHRRTRQGQRALWYLVWYMVQNTVCYSTWGVLYSTCDVARGACTEQVQYGVWHMVWYVVWHIMKEVVWHVV